MVQQTGEAVSPKPVPCTISHHRGVTVSVFLLDSDIADIPELIQEPLPDNLTPLTPQAPLNEANVEKLVQSIQEVLHGELKVCMAVLMSNPIYSF